jgi:hypothetical protein
MQLRLAPGNQAPVVPDEAVAIVEGLQGHQVLLAPKGRVKMLPRTELPGGELYIAEDASRYLRLLNKSTWLT